VRRRRRRPQRWSGEQARHAATAFRGDGTGEVRTSHVGVVAHAERDAGVVGEEIEWAAGRCAVGGAALA
jgi:hypothetical protein